jgi:hypothetical protein
MKHFLQVTSDFEAGILLLLIFYHPFHMGIEVMCVCVLSQQMFELISILSLFFL